MPLENHTANAFLDLPPEFATRERSRVLVLPVPYEKTTCYVRGTEGGPAAILAASHHVEYYDEILRDEPFRRSGIHTLPPLESGDSPKEAIEAIRKEVSGLASEGRFLLLLGGEHGLTVGAVRGVAEHAPPLTVVQVDAHADLRDEYEGSSLSHACVMRRLADDFPSVQVGIRSLSKGEADFAAERNLDIHYGHDIAAARLRDDGERRRWIDEAIDSIATEHVYLTVDLDGLDPSIMPAVGTPVPGGLLWFELLTLVRTLFERRTVVAADVVELCPVPGIVAPDFLAADLTYKIAGHALRA